MRRHPVAICKVRIIIHKSKVVKIMENSINDENSKQINDKLLDYAQELVMLNFIYEEGIVTKEELEKIRNDIMKSYGIKGRII